MNETLMQYFEWYLDENHELWNELSHDAEHLARMGVTMVWMPPAYKGNGGGYDVGYGVYDHYDLGEFCSKGSVETKYGSKDEYLASIKALHAQGIRVLADIVLNHMMGGDQTEHTRAVNVQGHNRMQHDGDYYDVQVWTRFTFPERKNKYSAFEWNASHFTGTDFDQNNGQNHILKFEGKEWSDRVSNEQGNFDYIMGNDIDFSVPEVVEELYRWGIWYTDISGVDGFRLDAIKSIDTRFYLGWLKKMREYGNHPDFAVGEYWSADTNELVQYLKNSGHCMLLFDVPLHYRLSQISTNAQGIDLRKVFDGTLAQREPEYACVFCDNHDTQPGQALYSWVDDWFKPISYALLLLRDCKYPCVFYGDLYGIPHDQKQPVPNLEKMIWIRRNLLSGDVVDFNDEDPQKTCWLTPGEHPVIVIASIGDWKSRRIDDLSLANRTFTDINWPDHKVVTDENGAADFTCPEGNVTVYILEEDYQAMMRALNQ